MSIHEDMMHDEALRILREWIAHMKSLNTTGNMDFFIGAASMCKDLGLICESEFVSICDEAAKSGRYTYHER